MIGLYEAIDAAKSGTRGALILGGYIHEKLASGSRMQRIRDVFESRGIALPENPTLTKYRHVWEAWVVNAKLPIDGDFTHPSWTDDAGKPIPFGLTGISIYKLYEARNLIDRSSMEATLHTLMWVAQTPIDDVRDEAANRGLSDAARVRSLGKMAEGDYDQVRRTHQLAKRVDPELSRNEWLVLMSQFFEDMCERDEAAFRQLVRGYTGTQGASRLAGPASADLVPAP